MKKDFKNYKTKPNYFYAIISVALVLFLLGFFGFIVLQGKQVVKYAKEHVDIIIEMKSEASQLEVDKFRRILNQRDFLKVGTIKFISKEEGAELMQKEFGEDFLKLDLPNPLYDIFTFNVKSDYLTANALTAVKEDLMRQSVVRDVFYQES